MKISKIFLTVFTVMLILAGTSIASAGDGTSTDPYTVYYVGWSWNFDDWGMGNGTSMGNGSGSLGNWTTYNNYSDVYTGDIIAVTSNKSGNVGNNVYYKLVYADLDTMWFNGSTGVPSHVTNLVSTVGYDYLIVDMFYSTYMNNMNTDNSDFVNATTISPAHKASIFSLGYDGESYAPANFEYRDILAKSPTPNSQFALDINTGLSVSGASATSANFSQFMTVLSYLN